MECMRVWRFWRLCLAELRQLRAAGEAFSGLNQGLRFSQLRGMTSALFRHLLHLLKRQALLQMIQLHPRFIIHIRYSPCHFQ